MGNLRRMDPRELAFAGAAEQARMLAAGAVTAPELVELYLDRIARIDPVLRCYRTVLAADARAEARAAQARLDAGERLPLLGVPGVTPASESPDYYRDTRQFRPLRATHRGKVHTRL